jgi:hypothetical protein
MSTTHPGVAAHRPLTESELAAILSAIDAADSTRDVYAAVVAGVYDALLADTGRSTATLPDGENLDPSAFAIPSNQWQAIAQAAVSRAAQWGTGAALALQLVNVMPSAYDDPTAVVPVLDLPDRRPYVHELHVSRDAADVITAATAHVQAQALADFFGYGSQQHRRAERSWLPRLTQLFSLGMGADTQISRDGELSLLVRTGSGYLYGLIFHADTRRCVAGDGCTAVIDDTGTAHAPYSSSVLADHEHVPAFPIGAPRPGQWSVHS